MRARLTGLWRHPDFLKLWAGQTVSLFGSLITGFALPLVAVLTLQAGPLETALLGAAGLVPGLLLGLFAGVWVDRLRRRPILIAADIGRMVLVGSVPLAAALGWLRIEQLYVVAFLVSALSICFEVAYRSYLPSLVRREQLVEGNSKLAASGSVAEVAGLGLAGLLVQALTAPLALLVDALSFLLSALSLGLIRTPEPAPTAPARRDAWQEIREGVTVVWRDPALRALAGADSTTELFSHIFVAVLMLYLVRDLNLEPVVIGMIFGAGGLSALVGALLAEPLTRRWGVGRTLLGAWLAYRGSGLLLALAGGPLPLLLAILVAGQALDAASTIYDINRVSLIQAGTPRSLIGRVHASLRVLGQGSMLLGLVIGGLLGEWIGLRGTVMVGAFGALLGLYWLLRSPIVAMRAVPAIPEPEPVLTA